MRQTANTDIRHGWNWALLPRRDISPPMPEYSGYDYAPSHPMMAVDTPYGMSIPPPYASMPLPMPSHSWPSMLTTQSSFGESGLPPAAILNSVSPSAPMPPIRKTSTGALFGVERSTVSKVLRQKEKYLNPDDGSRSPIKRAKGRVPDIEKALSNWVRNYHRQGFPLNDEMIKEKALFFASTCGCPEGKEKVLTTSWLEKFKNKNGLVGAKSRKGSIDARSGSNSPTRINTDSAGESAIQSPSGPSPTSPTNGFGSPLSPTQSQEGVKKELAEALPDLAGGYQHGHSKSTTSLDTTSSAGMVSPTSTLVSDSPFTPTSQSRLPSSGTSTQPSRPRSQTFPLVPIDPSLLSVDESMDHHHHHHHEHQSNTKPDLHRPVSVAVLDSPLEMGDNRTLEQTNVIKRNRSNPEIKTKVMHPPSKPSTVSPVGSPPGSPTQDEARRALELVMNYFQHQPAGLAAQEYVTIGKLMERLELAKSHQSTLLGGLTRIDEHEDVPRVSKKRIIHNLG
ncbi:hypothetical protein NUU61_009176 [Penicillium alfredii]|uniref:HTH CENPB-type domain-containing protein n=1 Tax=Penicillium alfredii TaxID=1506179 RepID=A0A9W9EMJ1_9EURO|nr:uncharacterized protein NUU61_009176 [Penicillium alfredii]KAJ5084597.1 hypothetical protein NUU61_009176 [Penicillium alfredii]